MSTVRIPADVDQDDKLLAGLTGRQLLLLIGPVVALWGLYMATRNVLPLVVFAPVAAVVGGVVGTLVVLKRDGISLDRFAIAAIAHHRSPKRQVTTPVDVVLPNDLGALQLPIVGVRPSGVIDVGSHGVAIACTARATNLALQSSEEQEAIAAAFGRFCNSIQDSVQFVTRTDQADLTQAADQLEDSARTLPSVGLEVAARDHARYLRALGTRYDVMARTTFVVFRELRETGTLAQRVADAAVALRAAGIELWPLEATQAIAVLQRAASPNGPRQPLAGEDEIVRGGQ